jgi:hypothetical protein
MRIYILVALAVAAFAYADYRAAHDFKQDHVETSYTKEQVRQMNHLVAHPDRGVVFQPRNEAERNQVIAYIFGEGER